MRGIRRALALSAVLALLPVLASADDPYADYRIPAHNWHAWAATLSSSGNHRLDNGAGFGRLTSGDLNGSVSSSYSGGYDSDPSSAAYGLAASLNGSRSHQSQQEENPFAKLEQEQRNRFTSESVNAFLAFTRYPWSAPLGLSLATNQALALAQSWISGDQTVDFPPVRTVTTRNSTSGQYQWNGSLSASAGWGRVRDATPVYQVQVLEQRLLEEGTIQHALSPAARERLAALYTMEARVAFAHQRPTKYFWGELERLLRDDGVLGEGGLDAYTVQRLLEPLYIVNKPRSARARGYFVGPSVSMVTVQTHVNQGEGFSGIRYEDGVITNSFEQQIPRSERNTRNDAILSGATAEYHRPFGMEWQLDAISRAFVQESGERILMSSSVLGTWLVSDRWFATAQFAHDLTAPGAGWDRHADRWNLNYGASVSYFLEDSWALSLFAGQQQAHATSFTRVETLSLGISYQVSGLLNAAGLFQPMRLAPPAN